MSMNLTVTTFQELETWVDAFMKPQGLSLMFLIGDPGHSKSFSIKRRLDADLHRYFKCGRLTAFQLYKQLFKHRDRAIILDDVEDALKGEQIPRMLMNLGETDEESRTVAWFGTESQLKVRKGKKVVPIPQEFKTSSRVLLVSNDFEILTRKLKALLDRGIVIFFDPVPEEVHRFVAEWFKDDEIFQFIGEHLDHITRHSIRYYVTAKHLKRLGLDWRKALLESWTQESEDVDPQKIVELLLADPRYKTDKERIEAFNARSGRHRRQWYYLKKQVMKRMRIPRSTAPASPSSEVCGPDDLTTANCTPDDLNFYPTPPWVTEELLRREEFGSVVWEPACGDGAISKVLEAAGYTVLSSDIKDRGYGEVLDFFKTERTVESIVTNPDYRRAEEFVRKALASTTQKVAMFLRASFFESQRRAPLFAEHPPKRIYMFARRVSLYPGGEHGNNGGGQAMYAWFVWEHGFKGETTIQRIE